MGAGGRAWRRGDLDRGSGLEQQSLRLLSDDRMGRTFCVQALAWIAASRNQHERAAVLLGAATGLWQSIGTALDSHQPLAGHHRDCERQARQAMGEAAYQAAYCRGAGPARRRCPRLRPRAVAGEAAGRPRCPTGRR